MGNLANYLAQAKQQTAGSYNAQKAQLQSAYNDQLAQYGNSIKDINTNYTSSVDTANRNNQNNLNAYNNNVLSRGLARSSIASTGLAGINNTNARVLGELNSTKNNQLDRINQLKETLRNNLNSSLTSAQSQYDSNAYTLANQLMQRDEDVAYRNSQLAEQKRQFDAQMAFQKQKAAQDAAQAAASLRARYSSGGSGSAVRSTISTSLMSQGKALMNEGYSDDYMYDWISGLDTSSSQKAALANQLGISKPNRTPVTPVSDASTSNSSYYGNGSTYKMYSGGR